MKLIIIIWLFMIIIAKDASMSNRLCKTFCITVFSIIFLMLLAVGFAYLKGKLK